MYFPDRGCVHTLLTSYVYATDYKPMDTQTDRQTDGQARPVTLLRPTGYRNAV